MPADPESYDPDKELVERCLAGDTAARERFALRYGPFLAEQLRWVLRRSGEKTDPAWAEDLAQELFTLLLRDDCAALRAFRWDSSLNRYLALIAGRHAVHFLRRQGAWRGEIPEELEPRDETRPDSAAEKRQSAERVRDAMGRLPPRERLALLFHYWDGLPAEQVARLLSIRNSSARSLLTRARERLRKALRGIYCV